MKVSFHARLRILPFLFAAAIILVWVLAARAQNLVTNPGFEEEPHAPSSIITGWVVGGTGDMHSKPEGSTSGIYSAAFSIGHDSEGTTLTQTLSTTVGVLYALDFDAGVFGVPTNGVTLQLHVEVTDPATLVYETVTPPVSNTFTPGSVVFQHYHFVFTANSTNTTLQFSDIGFPGNAAADVVLDTVSVAPTPTPPPNLVTNGGFEIAPYNTTGDVTDWTVSGHVASNPEGATNGTHSAALSDGGESENDVLSQSFTTINGQVYTLDFDAGIYGQRIGNLLQIEVNILGGNLLLHKIITPPDAFTFDPNAVTFGHYQYVFMADGNAATVQFISKGLGNAFADQLVDMVAISPAPALQLSSAFSRKTQGGTDFNLNLPLTGEPAVECRAGTPAASQKLVLTFTNNVLAGSASVSAGSVSGVGTPVFAGNTMTVDLTGVADSQLITVTLSGLTDIFGQVLPNTSVSMNVLLGDATADKFVDSADIGFTKAKSGSILNENNFRADLNSDGSINSADVALAKARSGSAIPQSRQQARKLPVAKRPRLDARPVLPEN